ncbi:MAG: D-alanine--D-alanine ligase [Planctomycetia bacterium]|nr:D-alanine--D-alanine ligase [Planctomycetia bacterium]
MKPLEILLLYNEPALSADDPDWASEAGVLESVEAVWAALVARGHRARKLGLGSSVAKVLESLANIGTPDVVFNLFEGLGGVGRGEAEITGLVELLGFPVTGSPAECLALVRDKARTKWLLAGAGLPSPEFLLIAKADSLRTHRLDKMLSEGPLIVKPAHEDASLGIGPQSVVTDLDALTHQIQQLRGRYGPVIVERFIVGREFNAAILALSEPELLPLAEIEFSGDGPKGWQIVTYDAKWDAGSIADRATPPRCPARVDQQTHDRISQIALAAFRLTGCRDYARVDLRMDDQGRVYVLEVNGNPDIGPSAGLARALAVAGIGYEEFVERLVEYSFSRRTPHRSAAPSVVR